jgi:hypothetical protein
MSLRLGWPAGLVAFVANAGCIDSNGTDGLRLTLADECAAIHVVNLRRKQRTQGELSRPEGGKNVRVWRPQRDPAAGRWRWFWLVPLGAGLTEQVGESAIFDGMSFESYLFTALLGFAMATAASPTILLQFGRLPASLVGQIEDGEVRCGADVT